MQSKRWSLIEAGTNTLVGLVLAVGVNMLLMRFVGVTANTSQNVVIVLGHTLFSVIRSYLIRRCFNGGWQVFLNYFKGRTKNVDCKGN